MARSLKRHIRLKSEIKYTLIALIIYILTIFINVFFQILTENNHAKVYGILPPSVKDHFIEIGGGTVAHLRKIEKLSWIPNFMYSIQNFILLFSIIINSKNSLQFLIYTRRWLYLSSALHLIHTLTIPLTIIPTVDLFLCLPTNNNSNSSFFKSVLRGIGTIFGIHTACTHGLMSDIIYSATLNALMISHLSPKFQNKNHCDYHYLNFQYSLYPLNVILKWSSAILTVVICFLVSSFRIDFLSTIIISIFITFLLFYSFYFLIQICEISLSSSGGTANHKLISLSQTSSMSHGNMHRLFNSVNIMLPMAERPQKWVLKAIGLLDGVYVRQKKRRD